ncbi:endonuclease/exonuclease/phosphatase family protein [Mucilaginibacter sp. SG564]|uniref:endonuclease/exonuclease/phosphatase family protein n=1 Tax=unclassified Mucilaginibacter TaxID=2617802 RepID=UPI001551BBBA|nr:endonuclease/exonuclease/phosphatase family protein [Mucilaginibacter sp. SG564]NOW96552.1 endonuclease/exonuclease/phosphatase family metal-dependent hydrolase [Mucilaginibacter sp. SG564]
MKVKRKQSFIGKIILWINLLLCVALLISYLAPNVDPRKVWLFAFFGLAYPVLLIFNLIMLTYWVLRRRWQFLLSLVTILLGYGVLFNNIGFRLGSAETEKPAATNAIRVMTYNVHNFKRYGASNDISTKHQILTLISQQQPDIIGFQEFYTKNKGQYEMRDSLIRIIGASNFYFEPFNFNNTEAIGMAIFSRFPIVGKGLIRLTETKSENQCLFVDVKRGEKVFRFYSVHLQSIRFDPEDYKYLDSVSKKGKTDMQSTKRLGGKLKIAFEKRSEQVFKIKEHAAKCPYPYLITGDFNDTPTSFAVNQMAKGLKNAFRQKGSGFGRTYNGDFPNYQIDYIMASPQFDVATYKIIEKKLSDHYPLRSDVVLN